MFQWFSSLPGVTSVTSVTHVAMEPSSVKVHGVDSHRNPGAADSDVVNEPATQCHLARLAQCWKWGEAEIAWKIETEIATKYATNYATKGYPATQWEVRLPFILWNRFIILIIWRSLSTRKGKVRRKIQESCRNVLKRRCITVAVSRTSWLHLCTFTGVVTFQWEQSLGN